jgi:predicted transposase YbfD/YdcC
MRPVATAPGTVPLAVPYTHLKTALGQVKVPDGSNEITGVTEIMRRSNVEGYIVTADALNCQKTIVAQIQEQKADYLLALKDNQKSLSYDCPSYFAQKSLYQRSDRIDMLQSCQTPF